MARLALPVVATQVSLMLMGVVDTIMVARLGETELDGVAIGNALLFIVASGLSGVLYALDALVGQLHGAGDREGTGRALWQGYWLALALGVLGALVFVDGAALARLVGQSEAVSIECGRYLDGRVWAMPAAIVWAAQRSFLSGVGDTRAVMVVSLLANVVNALLDWALIYGKLGAPALGTYGAGLATGLCICAMVAHAAWVIHRRGSGYAATKVAPDPKAIWRLLVLGVPVGLHLAGEMGVFSATAFLAGRLGETALAAHQIALNLSALTFMVPLGVSFAASVRVAQCIGAGDTDGAARAGRIALGLGVAFMACSALVLISLPTWLIGLYTPKPAVVAAGASLLRVAALFQISDALQVVGAGCLRGTGDTRSAMIANLVAHWGIGLPLGALLCFPLGLGVTGLWIGLTASLTVVGIWLCVRFLGGKWRTRGRLGI